MTYKHKQIQKMFSITMTSFALTYIYFSMFTTFQVDFNCRNPSLGLTTKARACKVAGQEGSLGVRLHALGSARKCEGIDPHTPKGTPTLGVGVPVDS